MSTHKNTSLVESIKDITERSTIEEAFSRLPGHVIGNELYSINRKLDIFLSGQMNGDDVNEKELNQIIKSLTNIKKEVKRFNKKEDVPVSYMYKKESVSEMTKDFKPHWMYNPKDGEKEWAEKPEDHERLNAKGWVHEDPLDESKSENKKDIADLEKLIKNPDPSKVKEYGGTKYVDMLKAKVRKLKENTSVEEASSRGHDWLVFNLDTKKVKYFKTYDAASKFAMSKGGVIATLAYFHDNKDKFFEGADSKNEQSVRKDSIKELDEAKAPEEYLDFQSDDKSFRVYQVNNKYGESSVKPAEKANENWAGGAPIVKTFKKVSKAPIPKGKFWVLDSEDYYYWFVKADDSWYALNKKYSWKTSTFA